MLPGGKSTKPGIATVCYIPGLQVSVQLCVLGYILITFREQVLRLHGISLELHWAVHY